MPSVAFTPLSTTATNISCLQLPYFIILHACRGIASGPFGRLRILPWRSLNTVTGIQIKFVQSRWRHPWWRRRLVWAVDLNIQRWLRILHGYKWIIGWCWKGRRLNGIPSGMVYKIWIGGKLVFASISLIKLAILIWSIIYHSSIILLIACTLYINVLIQFVFLLLENS